MSNIADMAAEPVEIKLRGETYKVSPLTLGDWAKIHRWAEDRYYEDVKKRLSLLSPEERAEFLKQFMSIGGNELKSKTAEYMNDPEASALELYLMLKHNHKEITIEQARDLLTFADFTGLSAKLNNPEGSKENPPGKS